MSHYKVPSEAYCGTRQEDMEAQSYKAISHPRSFDAERRLLLLTILPFSTHD